MNKGSSQYPKVKLIVDRKIHQLLRHEDKRKKFEASGICNRDGYYVIFDNLREIAHIKEFVN